MSLNTRISLRKQLALSLFKRYKRNATRLHELKHFFWECTLRCNLNCLHCGSDCQKSSTVHDMPVSDFLRAIDELKPHINSRKTLIIFTGGEPLMRNDIEKCGTELYLREFPWGMVTNGLLLNAQRLEELLDAGLCSLTISLDGLTESHDWFRNRPGTFDKALNAIELAAKTPNLIFDVVTCAHPRNVDELPQLKNLLLKSGVRRWRIFSIAPIGRAKNNPQLSLTDPQLIQVLDFIRQCRKEGKIHVNYGCSGFLGNYEGEVRDSFFFCRAGINVGSILADGSISACPNLRDRYIQGNIYTDRLSDVWENRFGIMRDRQWTKTGECADCKQYEWCQGNGLHLRNPDTNELLLCHYKHIKNGISLTKKTRPA